MIRIAIVEDDPASVQQLLCYLQTYEKEWGERLHSTVFSDGDEIVEGYSANFDLILLDIQMPYLDGMTAAQEIRKRDPEVVILFFTHAPQYAIQGYKVDALDYMLKPISYFAFAQRLRRAITRMKRREQTFCVIAIPGGQQKIDLARLYYVESQGHRLVYHTADGVYTSSGTLKDLEARWEGLPFVRGNKGCLINLEHVEGIQDGFAQVHHQRLQLSRSRRREFLEALTNYLGDRIR